MNKKEKYDMKPIVAVMDRALAGLNKIKEKWINVADKLPKEDGWYITYSNGKVGYLGFDGSWCGCGAGGSYRVKVTHWQSLPKPPK